MNKTEIKNLLISNGISGVVSTRRLADVLGLSSRTITAAKNKGQLPQIDRNTFALDSIVTWLHGHQRYLVNITNQNIQGNKQ